MCFGVFLGQSSPIFYGSTLAVILKNWLTVRGDFNIHPQYIKSEEIEKFTQIYHQEWQLNEASLAIPFQLLIRLWMVFLTQWYMVRINLLWQCYQFALWKSYMQLIFIPSTKIKHCHYNSIHYSTNLSSIVRKPVLTYANNKGADQPAHPRSLISTFVVRCLDSIIPLVCISEISNLCLASVPAQAGLCLTWLQTPKTGFLMTRLIWRWHYKSIYDSKRSFS